MSKLDSFIRRMQAQRACIDAACEMIRDVPGPVFELGLGVGRTYSHLTEKLPAREVFVFDRQLLPHVVCVPAPSHLVLGELAETLPHAIARFAGAVALVHIDVGTADIAYGMQTAAFISQELPAALAPGAMILSDQRLSVSGTEPTPLPEGVAEGRYFMYRSGAAAAGTDAPVPDTSTAA